MIPSLGDLVKDWLVNEGYRVHGHINTVLGIDCIKVERSNIIIYSKDCQSAVWYRTLDSRGSPEFVPSLISPWFSAADPEFFTRLKEWIERFKLYALDGNELHFVKCQ